MVRLKDVIPLITHRNWKVFMRNSITDIEEEPLIFETVEDIKKYLEFQVFAIDEDWKIIIHGG